MARLTSDQVIAGLMRRGVPLHVAQGVAMNFRDESGLDTGIQERSPRSGRGGYGLAQWTGPRRIGLERYAAAQGASAADPEVQLDYFMQENAGPERGAWSKVMAAPSAQQAAAQFVTHWERPAAEHRQARVENYLGARHVGGAGSGSGNFEPPAANPMGFLQALIEHRFSPMAQAPQMTEPMSFGEMLLTGHNPLRTMYFNALGRLFA